MLLHAIVFARFAFSEIDFTVCFMRSIDNFQLRSFPSDLFLAPGENP